MSGMIVFIWTIVLNTWFPRCTLLSQYQLCGHVSTTEDIEDQFLRYEGYDINVTLRYWTKLCLPSIEREIAIASFYGFHNTQLEFK